MVQGIAARRKRYVEVEATFLEDGRIVPRAVIWHDGRRFPVRAVLGRRRCASLKEIVYEPLDPLLDGGACAWGAD